MSTLFAVRRESTCWIRRQSKWRATEDSSQPQVYRHNDATPPIVALRSTDVHLTFCIRPFSSPLQKQLPESIKVKHTNKIKMPVPLPSTTSQSTSATNSSATAQTAHNVENPSTQSVASATHTQKTEQEKEAERLYEERIEEEYAKREGGA
ncbi:hypothetical protein BKA66DRAFT_574832 [Pyrenochaeta sp. MPI-SDFR-AT-0127]|nr:hypothetical protein BKA66DRAFT_574832 [Pyrenochaeta sp. MPI-SDFR-AT-0127]